MTMYMYPVAILVASTGATSARSRRTSSTATGAATTACADPSVVGIIVANDKIPAGSGGASCLSCDSTKDFSVRTLTAHAETAKMVGDNKGKGRKGKNGKNHFVALFGAACTRTNAGTAICNNSESDGRAC